MCLGNYFYYGKESFHSLLDKVKQISIFRWNATSTMGLIELPTIENAFMVFILRTHGE